MVTNLVMKVQVKVAVLMVLRVPNMPNINVVLKLLRKITVRDIPGR